MSRQIGNRHRRLRYDGTLDSNGGAAWNRGSGNAVFEGSYRIRSKFCGDDGNRTYVRMYEWKKGLEADSKTSTKSRYGLK